MLGKMAFTRSSTLFCRSSKVPRACSTRVGLLCGASTGGGGGGGGRGRRGLGLVLLARDQPTDGSLTQLREDLLGALVDELLQRLERNRAAVRLLLLEDDLRERDLGQIVLRVVVDDLHFFAAADHLGDLQERDVPAVLRVVELAVRVALDDAPPDRRWRARDFGFCFHDGSCAARCGLPVMMRRVIAERKRRLTGPAAELRGVSARYTEGLPSAVSDVNLDVSAGRAPRRPGPQRGRKIDPPARPGGHAGAHGGRGAPLRQARSTPRTAARVARMVAVVPQLDEVAFGFTVREVVLMGRAPHQSRWMQASAEDEREVDVALERCDLAQLRRSGSSTSSAAVSASASPSRARSRRSPRCSCSTSRARSST